jgi:hypothetical protein
MVSKRPAIALPLIRQPLLLGSCLFNICCTYRRGSTVKAREWLPPCPSCVTHGGAGKFWRPRSGRGNRSTPPGYAAMHRWLSGRGQSRRSDNAPGASAQPQRPDPPARQGGASFEPQPDLRGFRLVRACLPPLLPILRKCCKEVTQYGCVLRYRQRGESLLFWGASMKSVLLATILLRCW